MAFADVLVVGGLVRILETSPATDVVDEDDLEIDVAALDIIDEPYQRLTSVDDQATPVFVAIGSDDYHPVRSGVGAVHNALVVRGVFLFVGGAALVWGGEDELACLCRRLSKLGCLRTHFPLRHKMPGIKPMPETCREYGASAGTDRA